MPHSLLSAQYEAWHSMSWMNVWIVCNPALLPHIISDRFVARLGWMYRVGGGRWFNVITNHLFSSRLSAKCSMCILSFKPPVALWNGYDPHVTDEKNSERLSNLLTATQLLTGGQDWNPSLFGSRASVFSMDSAVHVLDRRIWVKWCSEDCKITVKSISSALTPALAVFSGN